MLFKYVSGNNFNHAVNLGNHFLNNKTIPIINYVIEDCKNKEILVFNEYNNLLDKLDNRFMIALKLSSLNFNNDYINIIANKCKMRNIKLIIDAENNININKYRKMTNELIFNYNKEKLNIIKTYQMYRKNSLNELKDDINFFNKKNNIFLSSKLVRGAYWNSEYNSGDLYINKNETDENYNNGLFLCNKKLNNIFIAATHNKNSIELVKKYNNEKNKNNQSNIILANLMGMNENYTKNLNIKKATYIPYGPYREMIPYLIRRLYENIDQIKYMRE